MSKHTREDSPKQWRQWKQYGSSELRNLWLQMQEGLPALPQPSSPAAHTCITMQPSSNVHCGGVFPRISEALCSLAGVGSGNHACYVLCRQDRGRAGQGRAEQGRAGQGRAGQGRAEHHRAGQNRADRPVRTHFKFSACSSSSIRVRINFMLAVTHPWHGLELCKGC